MLNLKVERMEEWWPCLARVPAMNVVDASELRGEQCECRGCIACAVTVRSCCTVLVRLTYLSHFGTAPMQLNASPEPCVTPTTSTTVTLTARREQRNGRPRPFAAAVGRGASGHVHSSRGGGRVAVVRT